MGKEIEIVTAFFSINRENWKGFQRSDELYFNYFKEWAKLKNNIIVYTEKEELKEQILSFRSDLGLKDKTKVVVIPDISEIAPALLSEMQSVAKEPIHKKFRLMPEHPEVWNATYDYVMLLKMWCCADAVEKGYAKDMVAWMDFGYNHGGTIIDSTSNFNYLWTYDFPEKINVFLIQELDKRPIFDIIFSMDTYIMGMMIVASANLWGQFWNMMQENMRKLISVGIIDDDQNVILMCLREHPELFNTYKSSWQMPLKQFGGEHLKLSKVAQKDSMGWLRVMYHRFRHKILCHKYARRICKHMNHIIIH